MWPWRVGGSGPAPRGSCAVRPPAWPLAPQLGLSREVCRFYCLSRRWLLIGNKEIKKERKPGWGGEADQQGRTSRLPCTPRSVLGDFKASWCTKAAAFALLPWDQSPAAGRTPTSAGKAQRCAMPHGPQAPWPPSSWGCPAPSCIATSSLLPLPWDATGAKPSRAPSRPSAHCRCPRVSPPASSLHPSVPSTLPVSQCPMRIAAPGMGTGTAQSRAPPRHLAPSYPPGHRDTSKASPLPCSEHFLPSQAAICHFQGSKFGMLQQCRCSKQGQVPPWGLRGGKPPRGEGVGSGAVSSKQGQPQALAAPLAPSAKPPCPLNGEGGQPRGSSG